MLKLRKFVPSVRCLFTTNGVNNKIWEDPWKHAVPEIKTTYTDVEEVKVDWSLVQKLMPVDSIPPMPKFDTFSPSGWKAPSTSNPDVPYTIARRRDHMLPLYIERRRDKLNEKSMEYEYVEIVSLKHISGDIFSCAQDLKTYVEDKVGHPIATSVDELKGTIKVKGADRSLMEQFIYDKGF
uniref:39S ribosomal protein L49, mitochondrial n=1 Tax=Rhabditophanes sp. KR3021 TaxID=114890 RepID=A0AC35UE59_9BILA